MIIIFLKKKKAFFFFLYLHDPVFLINSLGLIFVFQLQVSPFQQLFLVDGFKASIFNCSIILLQWMVKSHIWLHKVDLEDTGELVVYLHRELISSLILTRRITRPWQGFHMLICEIYIGKVEKVLYNSYAGNRTKSKWSHIIFVNHWIIWFLLLNFQKSHFITGKVNVKFD